MGNADKNGGSGTEKIGGAGDSGVAEMGGVAADTSEQVSDALGVEEIKRNLMDTLRLAHDFKEELLEHIPGTDKFKYNGNISFYLVDWVPEIPSSLAEINGDLRVVGSKQFRKMPDNLTVRGVCEIKLCETFNRLPKGLTVERNLNISNALLQEVPEDLNAGRVFIDQEKMVEEFKKAGYKVTKLSGRGTVSLAWYDPNNPAYPNPQVAMVSVDEDGKPKGVVCLQKDKGNISMGADPSKCLLRS